MTFKPPAGCRETGWPSLMQLFCSSEAGCAAGLYASAGLFKRSWSCQSESFPRSWFFHVAWSARLTSLRFHFFSSSPPLHAFASAFFGQVRTTLEIVGQARGIASSRAIRAHAEFLRFTKADDLSVGLPGRVQLSLDRFLSIFDPAPG